MMRRLPILLLTVLWALSLRAQSYVLPAVPDSITDPTARADYATALYWQHFDFADTTLLRADYAEQALSDFLALAGYASEQGRKLALSRWMDAAAQTPAAFSYFFDLGRHYLYNPESPLRNEAAYLTLLEHVVQMNVTDETVQSRACSDLKLLRLTQVGQQAPDFCFTTADGQPHSLSGTATDRQTLLLFYDPDCAHCRDLLFRLRHSSVLNQAISQGRLTVLAVYTEADETLWNETKADLPAQWVTAITPAPELLTPNSTLLTPNSTLPTPNSTLQTPNSLYDLSTLPVVFLLSPDKHILLRHPDFHQLTDYVGKGQ